MKDQFEKNIKSLVDEFSYDYDPKAWEQLSKKLPGSKGSSSWFQIGFFSTILILGLLGTATWLMFAIFFSSDNTIMQSNDKPTKQFSKQKNNTIADKNEKSDANTSSTSQNHSNQIKCVFGNIVDTDSLELVSGVEFLNDTENNTEIATIEQINKESATFSSQNKQTEISQKISSPILEQNKPNEESSPALVIPKPCESLSVSLDADAISYIDGLPRIHIKAETNATKINWSSSDLLNQQNNGADLLAFKAKTYTINVEGILDGCKESTQIKITANDDYNLLAVNAFNTNSRDERNATFMPYALTIRQIPFIMLIIDPDNGAVVYKTSDYQQPWDGIDIRSGQMVPAQKAYIWKVVLEQPLPKENSTYTGTIVRI